VCGVVWCVCVCLWCGVCVCCVMYVCVCGVVCVCVSGVCVCVVCVFVWCVCVCVIPCECGKECFGENDRPWDVRIRKRKNMSGGDF